MKDKSIFKWLEWLNAGREIEFIYENEEYFIGNYEEGRAIFKDNIQITVYYGDNIKLLSNAKINSIFLSRLIEDNKIDIQTIF